MPMSKFKKMPGSRRTVFEAIDRPVLRPLPLDEYQYSELHKARVGLDHHVEFDNHAYSVPYQLIRKEVEIHVTATTIEVLHGGIRVASHKRSYEGGKDITLDEHRPASHREYAQRTPQRLIMAAGAIGAATKAAVEQIFQSDLHFEEAYNRSSGILKLGKINGADRLEAACKRAVASGAVSFRSIKSILRHGLEQAPLPTVIPPASQVFHENVRGSSYFTSGENAIVNTKHTGRTDFVEALGHAQSAGDSDAIA